MRPPRSPRPCCCCGRFGRGEGECRTRHVRPCVGGCGGMREGNMRWWCLSVRIKDRRCRSIGSTHHQHTSVFEPRTTALMNVARPRGSASPKSPAPAPPPPPLPPPPPPSPRNVNRNARGGFIRPPPPPSSGVGARSAWRPRGFCLAAWPDPPTCRSTPPPRAWWIRAIRSVPLASPRARIAPGFGLPGCGCAQQRSLPTPVVSEEESSRPHPSRQKVQKGS